MIFYFFHIFLDLRNSRNLAITYFSEILSLNPMWKTHGFGTFSQMKFSVHVWNENVFTFHIPNSHVQWTGRKYNKWNVGAWNMYFTHGVAGSHMKINFSYETFISHMELKQFTNKVLFLVCEILRDMFVRESGSLSNFGRGDDRMSLGSHQMWIIYIAYNFAFLDIICSFLSLVHTSDISIRTRSIR